MQTKHDFIRIDRDDPCSSTSRVGPEFDLTDSDSVCVVGVKIHFLPEKHDTGSKGILLLSETSAMPYRMDAGIRIISPVQ